MNGNNMSNVTSESESTNSEWFPTRPPHVKDHQYHRINNFLKINPSLKKSTRQVLVEAPIAIVTADATTVPLETNTVRFIDTMGLAKEYSPKAAFGAVSAEYFLSRGYRVIYIHREDSIYFPFTKAFQRILEVNRMNDPEFFKNSFRYHNLPDLQIPVPENFNARYQQKCCTLIGMEGQISRKLADQNQFLSIDYRTVAEYLDLLEYLLKLSKYFGPSMIFYLSATVSNYYIPPLEVRKDLIFIFSSFNLLCFLLFSGEHSQNSVRYDSRPPPQEDTQSSLLPHPRTRSLHLCGRSPAREEIQNPL
jgi:hypothetical protein